MSPTESSTDWIWSAGPGPREWFNAFGRMRPQFHVRLFAEAILDVALRSLQGGTLPEEPPLFFTLESWTRFEADAREGSKLRVTVTPLSRTDKVIRSLLQIIDPASPEVPVAECVHVGAFIVRGERRIDEISERSCDIWDAQLDRTAKSKERSDQIAAEIADFNPPETDPPDSIRSYADSIQPEWIDRMGHMGIEHYSLIFERAEEEAWKAAHPDSTVPDIVPRRIHLRYLDELRLGDRFETVSTSIAVEEGGQFSRHRLIQLNEDGTSIPAALCEHLFVIRQ